MKRNRIIFVIVLLTFLILSIFAFFIHIKQNEYMDLKQKRSFAVLQQIIDGKIIFFRKMISKRLHDEVYENSRLKKHIIEDNVIGINKELEHIYKVIKRENKYIKSIHYITPENICKTDIHEGRSNKNIYSNYRKIVLEANRLKRAKYGFEIGDEDLLYRLELPVFFEKEYYGLVEIGVDPMLFVSDMTTIEKYLDATVIVNADKIKEYEEYEVFEKVVFENSEYVLFEDKPLFQKALESKDKIVKFEEHYYKFFEYDLLNYNAKVEGKILFAIHASDDVNWEKGLNLFAVVILIIVLVLFFIIIYFGFNYYDRKIKELIEHDKQNERLLFQQSKMASMGDMIGNIAHQWRQPLSTITTAASGMQMQKEFNLLEDDQFDRYVDTIMKQANYMSKTIDDFRNFFQSDKEKIKFNVKEAILKDIRLLDATFKSNSIDIDIKLHSNIEFIGHQNEFTQAILNILNNSKDQLKKLDNEIKVILIEGEKVDGKLIITIKDNGGGIDKNIIDKIFEPYFTTKHKSQGTGIGLFMTNEIISKHFFGKISVQNDEFVYENKTYKGACFIITIPLDE